MSGKLFVITAPSGAGKTSLIDAVMDDDPTLKLSVSYTTRAPRKGEKSGVDYHFVDDAAFLAMKRRGASLSPSLSLLSCSVRLNTKGSAIPQRWLIPESEPVMIEMSPKPNRRPNIPCVIWTSFTFSSDESNVRLLMIPSTWMIR